jgi:hypothetical protein
METDQCLWCGTDFEKMVGTYNRYCSLVCQYSAEHADLED